MKHILNVNVSLVLRLFFYPNAPCQNITLLNLRPLIFCLTTFSWLHYMTLTSSYSTIVYANTDFYLRVF